MNRAIDEGVAWSLLRTLASSGDGMPRIARFTGQPEVAIEINAEGDWATTSEVAESARMMLDMYVPLAIPRRVVVGQLGQSVDGRIATESGASHYVTGAEDLDRLHRLRALVDVVIVGANTVTSDDPQLTVRRVEGANPVRVILDPDARLDAGHRVFTDGAARTIAVRRAGAARSSTGVEEIFVPSTTSGILDLDALLSALRAEGLARVLVEGGGVTVSRFLQAKLLDRLHVAVAPMLIGSGRPSVTLDPIVSLDEALRPVCHHFPLGPDVLFDFDLRSPRE